MPNETNSLLLDEERRQASHQEVKGAIDDGVKTQIKSESARAEPEESAELAGVADGISSFALFSKSATAR